MSKPDQLAEALFVKFKKDFPLTDDKGPKRKIKGVSKSSVEQRLAQFYNDARDVKKSHGLWVISWARVALKLQQRLLHAGYPSDVVSKLLLAMIFTSSRRTE